MRLTLLLLAILSLGACTHVSRYEYLAEPIPALGPEGTAEVFAAFQEFLETSGYRKFHYQYPNGTDITLYQISGLYSELAMAMRLDWEDTISLTYNGGEDFEIHLARINHSFCGISKEDRKEFVQQTEAILLETSGETVKLRLISD